MESLMHEKTSAFRLMHLDPHVNSLFLILFSISSIFIKTYPDINMYIGNKKQMTET